ncbi:hypothetical protein [Bacteroides fluxus]|jgi:hypothetical protein
MLRRILGITFVCWLCLSVSAQTKGKFEIEGYVYENLGKTPLQGAMVRLIGAKGAVIDSMKTTGRIQTGSVVRNLSRYIFYVPRNVETNYIIEADANGYDPGYMEVKIKDLGSREKKRELPVIYLTRARQLQEVTVTASKVKFYHKLDTLIYDASAFQLAEGSMLDVLVAQLPGVEVKDNGQIFVNGKFVESLLLNGRDFFGKDNQLMLDNLGAYAVKDISVYERAGKQSEFYGRDMGDKDFVMDVRLKKEYQHGWMVNLEGGGGTEERYMGRAFGLYFTPYSQVAFFGGINNVNDQRKPGQNTTWTPESVPKGDQKVRQTGIDYNVSFNKSKTQLQGNATFVQMTDNSVVGTERTNLLPSGNTYDYQYNRARRRTTEFKQFNLFSTQGKYIWSQLNERVNYTKYENSSSYSAATFDEEKQAMNREIIDDIYSEAYVDQRDGLMNRSLQNNIQDGHRLDAFLQYSNSFKFKKNSDGLNYSFGGQYIEEKSDLFKDYTINYGDESTAAYKQNEYYNQPNKSYVLKANVGYMYRLDESDYIQPEYYFIHQVRDKDSHRYLLDRLEEEGIFGSLPAGYQSVLDLDNSFTSRYRDNTHQLSVRMSHWTKRFSFTVTPRVYIFDQSLDYRRGGKRHRVNRNTASFALASWTEMMYRFAFKDDPFMGSQATQSLKLSYLITPRTPDLAHLVPVKDAIDPLNIYEGVESLDNERLHNIELIWAMQSRNAFNNTLMLGYRITESMLTRGYSYDSKTGVRTIRSYNTNGNWNRFINNTLSWQFGGKKQFVLSSISRAEQSHMSDMIGVDVTKPVKSTVKNWFLTENLKLDWQLGKQKIGLRADVIWRDTRSTREDFTPFQAATLNYGVTGVFKLPANFGLSTDLTCYTRRGYADNALNTTDVVWNARLSYTAFKGRWVFMLDGFDILNRLSNVTYGVNAQARTVTYTNVLPRYAMLHVQYKFNIRPKKR